MRKTKNKKSRTFVPVPNLPPELQTKILSLLPVESLLRFRSTSKSYQSLIDNHHFINLHLQNSLNFNLILRRQSNLYLIDFPNLTTEIQLNLPFITSTNRISLLGSCNGLLCISTVSGDIAFFNINTRKLRVIPNLSIPHCPESSTTRIVHGFGFDRVTGDYKFVRILYFVNVNNHTFDSQVRVFIPRTNSWKVLPNLDYVPYFFTTRFVLCGCQYHKFPHTIGVLVENYLHWVVVREFNKFDPELFVIAFDLTHEIFSEVPLPEIGEVSSEGFGINVSVLGGCLCMVVSCHIFKIDVWVMKEYGCRDSWYKLFTLGERCLIAPVESLRILGYSSDESKVLLEEIGCSRTLFWYDRESEKVSPVVGIHAFHEAIICVESLVQPSFMFWNDLKIEDVSSVQGIPDLNETVIC